jgi:hypothetical protein
VLNTYAKYLSYFTLKPQEKKVKTEVVAIEFPKSVTILAGRVWVGYDEGSKFEAALSVWLQPKSEASSEQFGPNVYLGGVYLHRHTASTSQQDYYPLHELHALKPIRVNAGSRVIVNRDIFNIDLIKTFNAWDCELILVVDE